ncbi:aldo/keto reductase [Alicyclobacillus sp. SO9]|uniref:aldo/keto reductase n=1 Tax=Alicyclobacillus sp. SO9 TaxID=2665646 RepID=UPI0018E8B252|nr:aldo/keto reductase [Alicyclobacillus sp. SO9]QQE79936.1 aldo/keto reductase [Alicyclobacillus sp. SO9]
MQQRQLGSSELWVSEMGLGCMSLGNDQQKAVNLIHAALDAGVNFLDTADLYQQGLNEEFVGTAIRDKRKQVVIATKVGNRFVKGQPGWNWNPSKAYILSEVKESLRRLQTDYIDLYQLHGGTIEDPIDEIIEAFEQLQQEGLIRAYGISSIRPNVIRQYVERANIQSVMMQYSMLDRRPEKSILSLLQKHQISAIGRGPLAQGLLADRGIERISESGYLTYSAQELHQILSKLQEVSDALSRPPTEIALKYPLAHSVVATIVPGASKMEQLQKNILSAQTDSLTDSEIEQIQAVSRAIVYQSHR